MTKLIACAVLLQGLELLQIRHSFAGDGIWRWETLRKEFSFFPRAFQWLLDALLDYPRFIFVIIGQIGLALSLLVLPEAHAAVFIGLLLTTGLIALRWRGTFNGGADYMTVLVLLMLSVDAVFQGQPIVRLGCLWYLGLQTVFSYFIAGLVKLRNGDWRTGRALQRFLSSPPYDPPDFIVRLSGNSRLMWLGSWAILVFEVSFPIALLSPVVCAGVLSAAFVFHVANFAVFGLNRFIFAWCAAYPALYFCSTQRIFG
jgi:hypothetical protein